MAATAARTALAGSSAELAPTMTRLMVAPGATAWTISASRTSSPLANQGEADGARLALT